MADWLIKITQGVNDPAAIISIAGIAFLFLLIGLTWKGNGQKTS